MYDGRTGSTSPFEQTVYLLSTAGRAADRLLADRLGSRGMGRAHQTLLSALAQLGPHGRHDLVERAAATGTDADQALDDLLSAGLVHSMVVHIGGRQEVLTITPAGQAALDVLHEDASAVQEDLLAPLTKGQRAELNSLLRRVCAAAGRGAGRRTPARPGPRWVLTGGQRRRWVVEQDAAAGAAARPDRAAPGR
ncbi:MarR family transcriptional regulator [Kitasatospora xanthocidica]|uniref:MarR family transcriptional regulator n=1 Tax=Kitasatospora xanthocidica TaxID=83382 RepID=A0A372ZNV6_9ACTN|nr:MarR family winged helix-turn-helix transcriptional regulator [Kitasatospora xanthocidica]RGD57224.1 MarR family transcriptional regulator [Kitasatospora xanthocidica]